MFPIHGRIEMMNFGVGIPLNLFLLYLILRFSRKELGAYKHLLTIFAVYDIFLAIIEALFSATAFRLNTIITIVGRTFWETRHVCCIYVAAYSIPFFLTNLNFLYRYWAIKRPEKLSLFYRKKFQGALIAVVSINCTTWYIALLWFCDGDINEPTTILIRDLYTEKYNLTINDGWIIMNHWPNGNFALRPFLVVVYSDILLTTAFVTSLSLSTMTFYHIQISTIVSENYRKMQRTVLTALCAQAIVPLICVYVPYVNTLNAPFLGVESVISPEISASFVSAFPLWDALVIILLMKDYRIGAMSLAYGSGKNKIEAISGMFTSTVTATPPQK